MTAPFCDLHNCELDAEVVDHEDRRVEWRCPEGARLASQQVFDTKTGFPPGCLAIQT